MPSTTTVQSGFTATINLQPGAVNPGHVWQPSHPPGHQANPEETPPDVPLVKSEKKLFSGNRVYNVPLIEAFKGKLSGMKQDGEIGLEIECEGMNLFDSPISYWKTKPDHSLRAVNDHPPIEYILRKPLPRGEIQKAMNYLTKKLKEAGSAIQESVRTSVHVHVNCQQLTVKQIYQYICLYIIFEEMLVDFSGPDRVGNLFCLRAKDAENWIQILESAIQTENFNGLFNDNLRYTACNSASLGKFGSLEFRSLRGTVDQQLIQTWIDILLLLRDKSLEYDNPKSIVDRFQKVGPHQFLRDTFTSRLDLWNIFRNRPDIHKSMWDGLRLMRDVAYAIRWEDMVEKKHQPEKPSVQEEYTEENFYGLVNTFRVIQGVHRPDDERAGVYIIRYMDGTTYLENYNYGHLNEISVPTIAGASITIASRERYRIHGSFGTFIDSAGELNEDEYAPDQQEP